MRRTRIFLALLAALLVTVDTRPDGYGVKGGRSYKAAANAVASAHATANANGGRLGIAKSSAIATANANSNSGGASSAFASADASAYGGNNDETVTSEKENGNANGLDDSGDLRQSNDHGKDAEYECDNHEDGTACWNSDEEDNASDDEEWRSMEESQEDNDCNPIGVKGHGGAPGAVGQSHSKERHQVIDSSHSTALGGSHSGSRCAPGDSACLRQRPSVSNPYPTYEKNPHLSAGSSGPVPIDSGYGGNIEKPAAIGGSYSATPCTPGDLVCLLNQPGGSKPHQTSQGNPHSSTGSSSSVGIHGEVVPKPEIAGGNGNQAGIQCAPGDWQCSSHKPTVPESHTSYDENPHVLVDSQHTIGFESERGEQHSRDGSIGGTHAGTPCVFGDSKCSSHKPTVPESHPSYDKNPHMLVDSQHTIGFESQHEEHHSRGGSIGGSQAGTPCAFGDWKCSSSKPAVPNTHPAYNENPHMLVDSQHTVRLENEHGEQTSRPGSTGGSHAGTPCAFGDWKCSSSKPAVPNTHPAYNENPHMLVDSQHTVRLENEHEEQTSRPGSTGGSHAGTPCAFGDWKCSSSTPAVPNTHPAYNENPHMLVDSQHTVRLENKHEEQTSRPGSTGGSHAGTPCAFGDWKCSSSKPAVPNTHPAYNENPHMLVDSQHTVRLENEHEEQTSRPGSTGGSHAGTPCAFGDWKCSSSMPAVSNTHPAYNENPHMTVDSQHTIRLENEHGEQNSRTGSTHGSHAGTPCAFGDWKCSSHKSTVPNTHSTYDEISTSSVGSQHSTTANGVYEGHNTKPGTIGGSATPCANGGSTCFSQKPSVSHSHGIYNSNSGASSSGSTHSISFGNTHGDKPIGGYHSPDAAHQASLPGRMPETSNPFLNGQIDTSIIKNPSIPVELSGKKTYSSNPFLNSDNQVKPPTGSDHPINPPESHNHPGISGNSKSPEEESKPPNPFFSHHATTPSPPGIQHPGIISVPQKNDKFPNVDDHSISNGSPNIACDGSVLCSSNKPAEHVPKPSTDLHEASGSDTGHPEHKLNPANPFFTQYGHRAHSVGIQYQGSDNPAVDHPKGIYQTPTVHPSKDCHESGSCKSESSGHELENTLPTNHGPAIERGSTSASGHAGTQKPHDSNPFFDSKSDSHGSIPSKSENGPSSTNPFLGHNNMPFNAKKPDIIQACEGVISSAGCNNRNEPMDHVHGSVTGEHKIETASSFNQHGIKGHRPAGVKGGSHHQGYPIKLQGNSGPAENDDSGTEHETSAQSTANASAGANANAYASSSISGGNAQSSANASAKSQAYSGHGGDGSSNSWSSSSASASAFASSYSSSSSHNGWIAPEIPQVPAE